MSDSEVVRSPHVTNRGGERSSPQLRGYLLLNVCSFPSGVYPCRETSPFRYWALTRATRGAPRCENELDAANSRLHIVPLLRYLT